LIALGFVDMVNSSVTHIGGPWTVAVIIGTGIVVVGLVGGPRRDR
jgi:hypothetical protein